MDALTDVQVAELERFAVELSRPGMPVIIRYEPPRHVVVNSKRSVQTNSQERSFELLPFANLEHLKGVIKSHVGR